MEQVYAMLWLVIPIAFLAFKIYEAVYYRSDEFRSLRDRISAHIKDCNDLNDHIEDLKQANIGFNKAQYGHADYHDNSNWNFKRPELKKNTNAPNVHNCSRSVCDNSRKEPVKYVCKYFGFKADEETLGMFERMLNDFTAVQEGKKLLTAEKEQILSDINSEIPWLIKNLGKNRLSKELGFKAIDLSNTFYPTFVFRYVSSGGNASTENVIVMDIANLNAMVNYLNDRIRWKKSVAGQRALMTSKLRQHIIDRDGHSCRQCGIGTAQEPHLLLEVDHIVPVSKGGMTTEDNLQTLCWRCNRSKGAKMPAHARV